MEENKYKEVEKYLYQLYDLFVEYKENSVVRGFVCMSGEDYDKKVTKELNYLFDTICEKLGREKNKPEFVKKELERRKDGRMRTSIKRD